MKKSRVPIAHCPVCRQRLDAATDLEGAASPGPGDYTVCFRCCSALVFTGEMLLRLATMEDLDKTGREDLDRILETQQLLQKQL